MKKPPARPLATRPSPHVPAPYRPTPVARKPVVPKQATPTSLQASRRPSPPPVYRPQRSPALQRMEVPNPEGTRVWNESVDRGRRLLQQIATPRPQRYAEQQPQNLLREIRERAKQRVYRRLYQTEMDTKGSKTRFIDDVDARFQTPVRYENSFKPGHIYANNNFGPELKDESAQRPIPVRNWDPEDIELSDDDLQRLVGGTTQERVRQDLRQWENSSIESLANSDVLFFQYRERYHQPLVRLHRNTVINPDTLAVIAMVRQRLQVGEEFTVKPEQADEFAALLGTPNGRAACFLVLDHGPSLRIQGIRSISVSYSDITITFK